MFTNRPPPPAPSSILSLDDFYRTTHQLLLSLASPSYTPTTPPTPITLVMGNESSDFDSTISASALAWYLHTTSPPSPATPSPLPPTTSPSSPLPPSFIPLINVPRRYFPLRTEIAFEFTRLGIDASHVSFNSDVDLHLLARNVDLRVILTDHNRLTATQEWLAPHVVGVVDHHEDEHMYPRSEGSRVIAKSGSCCSHVTNLIQDGYPTLLSSSFAILPLVQLLTDVILVDTHNMNPDLHKATPTDARALAHLTSASQLLLFHHLRGLRNDVQGWSTESLLLKDSKTYRADAYGVLISTVPLPLDDWQRKNPAMIQELAQQAKEVDALIVLTSFTQPHTKEYKRDLLLIVPRHPPVVANAQQPGVEKVEVDRGKGKAKLTPEELFARLAQGLEGDGQLKLKTVDTTRPVAGLGDGERSAVSGLGAVEVGGSKMKEEAHDVLVRRYDQQNVSASRKQVAPQVEDILSKL